MSRVLTAERNRFLLFSTGPGGFRELREAPGGWWEPFPPNFVQNGLHGAELWLKQHPNDGELLLALGRISRRLDFFAKATDYLEQLLSQDYSTAAMTELAAVKTNLGEMTCAIHLYQSTLDSITHSQAS